MRIEKVLSKAVNSPGNLRFDEFVNLLIHFGFSLKRKTPGSHQVFKHDGFKIVLPVQPGKNGQAKKYQVKQFLGILEANNVL